MDTLKLLYIANLRLPTEKAYGIQIVKMCESFAMQKRGLTLTDTRTNAEEKNEVELVTPYRMNHIKEDIFDFYAIKINFKFTRIWAPDFYFPGKLDRTSVLLKDFISGIILAFYGLVSKPDIIYSRDEWPLYFLSFFPTLTRKYGVVFEAHKFSSTKRFFYKRFKNKNLKVVVITGRLKEDFIKNGFKPENILVASDGVDLEEFDINLSKEEARAKVGLPVDIKIVMYTGHLFEWKGADVLLEAARNFQFSSANWQTNFQKKEDILFVFVGGMDYDIKKFEEKARGLENVLILGQKLHKEIPIYLKAADVLVLPNSAKEEMSRSYTSPLKLFEYMASGRPIIASGLPSIMEILNKENAVLVPPDDPVGLAGGIRAILDNSTLGEELSKKSSENVKQYTWGKRAQSIINFIG